MTKGNELATDDAFWKIAFLDTGSAPSSEDSNITKSNRALYEDDYFSLARGTSSMYELSFLPYGPVCLRLAPLPLVDGSVNPLGSEAWYGSALLGALLLTADSEGNRIKKHMCNCCHSGKYPLHALELGSGAVGLSGFALWLMLARFPSQTDHDADLSNNCRNLVILSDNDPDTLQQLELNVRSNVANIRIKYPGDALPEFDVHYLDWNEDYEGYNKLVRYDGTDAAGSKQSSLQLVIGSELVYSTETAHACAKIVIGLLRQHPDVLVVIVQVADRDGWNNDFIPILQRTSGICVEEESPIQTNAAFLHEMASTLIRHGGTLDYFSDFAVCYISNRQDY